MLIIEGFDEKHTVWCGISIFHYQFSFQCRMEKSCGISWVCLLQRL